jgi:hypothetical protein
MKKVKRLWFIFLLLCFVNNLIHTGYWLFTVMDMPLEMVFNLELPLFMVYMFAGMTLHEALWD